MDERIIELEKEFEHLKFEKKPYYFLPDDYEGQTYFYAISGFKGNSDLLLNVSEEDELKKLEEIVKIDFEFTPEYLGVEYQDKIEILISPINSRSNHIVRRYLKDKPTELELNYFNNKLDISIQFQPENSLLNNIVELVRGRMRPIVLTITNFKRASISGKQTDIRNILNCILFDFGYSYNLIFEPVNIESLNRRMPLRRRNKTSYPEEKVSVIYKNYIPELIEYFNIGEKVDYPPFRFICYFHIIEYFSDKSAYFHASKRLKSLMLKPDFHINSDKYVNQAINFFKIESTKNTSDKIKIRRVISQFINKEDFIDYLKDIDMYEYFSEKCTIECSKPLILKAIDFETDSKFQESLMNRIYSLRCSIVHSNPDFDETKAIPFSPTLGNMEKLRKEIDMIYEIARTIIIESSN